jgi:hypothetical protein
MRSVMRKLVLGPVMAMAAGLLMVSSAQGATFDLGQVGTNHPCAGSDYTEIQTATGAAPRYDAPSDGTITSWSVTATGETDVFVQLKMFRPGMVAGLLQLIGESSTQGPLTPNMLNGPFTTSIPVKAGDVLGLDVVAGSGLGCLNDTTNAGDVAEEVNPDHSVVGDFVTTTSVFNPARVNVAATFVVPESGPIPPTGQRAAALKKCKKKFHKNHNKKRFKKCKKKANLLPV